MDTRPQTDPEIQSYIREIWEVNFDDILRQRKISFIVLVIYLLCSVIIISKEYFLPWPDMEDMVTYFTYSWWALLFFITPLVAFVTPSRRSIGNVTEDVIDLILRCEMAKNALQRSSNTVRQLIWSDRIGEISKELAIITEQVVTLKRILYFFQTELQNNRKYSRYVSNHAFPVIIRRYDDTLTRLLDSQILWFSHLMPEILGHLKIYLSQNKRLSIPNLEPQTASDPGNGAANQWILELQIAQLEAHIENLEIQKFIQEISEYRIVRPMKKAGYVLCLFCWGLTVWIPDMLDNHNAWLTIVSAALSFAIPWFVLYSIFKHNFVFTIAQNIIDSTKSMEKEKIALSDSFYSFLQTYRDDREQVGVNPAQIMDISKDIEAVSGNIRKFEAELSNLQNTLKNILPWNSAKQMYDVVLKEIYWHYAEILTKFINFQKLWLSQKTQEISENIQVFLSNHSKELAAMDTELARKAATTENATGQWALLLQKSRLEGHIGNLEKMRVRG